MTRPRIALLDARERGLDEAGLRAWARAYPPAAGAACVSRSYRWPYALVAWGAAARVGVDLERLEPLDRGFAESICTPDERAALGARFDDPALVASLWCGKEALAKALGDPLAHDPRRLQAPLLWPRGEAGIGEAGTWRAEALDGVPDGHVGWLCWRVPPDRPAADAPDRSAAGDRHKVDSTPDRASGGAEALPIAA